MSEESDKVRYIYSIYSFIGSVIYGLLLITLGQFFVKMMFSWNVSITEIIRGTITDWPWTAISVLPFFILGLNLFFWIYKNKKWPLYFIFTLGLIPLTFFYLNGYYEFEISMQQQAWTWGALAMGFTIFFWIAWSLFVSFSAFLIAWIIAIKNKITHQK